LFRSDPFSEWSADRRDHGRIIREPSKACQEQPLRREKRLTRWGDFIKIPAALDERF
jgi:hypothetical protein